MSEKLTKPMQEALRAVAARDGYYTPWALGTRTCEALRTRGLVATASETRHPFSGRFGNNPPLWITDTGRSALNLSGGGEG